MINVPKDPIFQETQGVVNQKVDKKSWIEETTRSWRLLNRDQRGMLTAALFLVLILPVAAIGVQQQVINQSRAIKESDTKQNPRPTPAILTNQLASGVVNQEYSAKIEFSQESLLSPLNVNINGLPDGVALAGCQISEIDRDSLVICSVEGLPTTSGEYLVEAMVRDKIGSTNQVIFSLIID